MEKILTEMLPVLELSEGCIVSKMGEVTAAYELTKPEIFTLSGENYETLHQALVKAIKVLPSGTVLHFQDWFTETEYRESPELSGGSFLSRASERFFEGRRYLDHRAYLFLTKKPS